VALEQLVFNLLPCQAALCQLAALEQLFTNWVPWSNMYSHIDALGSLMQLHATTSPLVMAPGSKHPLSLPHRTLLVLNNLTITKYT